MTVLVTGADGFVGGYLLSHLKLSGIRCIGTFYSELDLSNKSLLTSWFDNHPHIKIIIHAATSARQKTDYDARTLSNNLSMFLNLLDVSREKDIFLLNFGSGSDKSRTNWNLDTLEEEYVQAPPPLEDFHGWSKYAIARIISHSNHRKIMNLRIFGLFGEGEDYRYKFISNSIAKSLMGIDLEIVQDRSYDYCDILDLARLTEKIINTIQRLDKDLAEPIWPKDINFSSGEAISLVAIAKKVIKVVGNNNTIKVLNDGFGLGYSGSAERFIQAFPGFQLTDIDDSIVRLAKFYAGHFQDISREELIQDDYITYAKKISINE